ncbi:esterase/lipase family protein [Luteimonas terrae]|uniref:Pimeloyl-ACP methyl ester carboxylesterase n=1 Tax=Luteimonas terrae TaxID=1530191 RepID=A0ABU1XSK1_9GAMM|nr:alpha/beta hydrolase [Luteimonas terrae]MDR7191737.1 pimeloyl-ACP methyl ester carboxylesterase [Luteimonas terrae]
MSAAPTRVLLLHGIWMVGLTMRRFARGLAEAGFETEIIGYPSIAGGPDAAAERLADALAQGPAHVVGHSLGGLSALRAAGAAPDLPVGRIVCLGSPVCGSGAAHALSRVPMSHLYFGRSADILQAGCVAWPAGLEVGMVAGCVPRGLGALLARFDGPHDGTVSVEETRAPALADHIVVQASHSGLLLSADAVRQTVGFLRHGRFEHARPRHAE